MQEESFEQMLDSYQQDRETPVRVGEKIQGTIIQLGKETGFVDVGAKVDAVVPIEDLKDKDGNISFAAGDTIELFVVAAGPSEIRLSRAMSGIGGMHLLEEAFESGIPVEGKVTGTRKGGFDVKVMGRRAFCPLSQMDTAYVEDPERFVGLEDRFVITKLEEGGRNIVLSRRQLLEEEQQKARESFVQEVRKGDLLKGRVVRLEPFGAFVELAPNVEGLAHISELSWSRVGSPDEVVGEGDTVQVKVLSMDQGKGGQIKIGLSMKQAKGDPWETVTDRFAQDEIVNGKVTRLAPFGAFVEIAPGIEGLVHISEMSFLKRVHKPEEEVGEGEEVSVKILSIDPEKRRISLSLREAAGDPWADVQEKYEQGQAVKGKVEKVEPFGIFVLLEPGITGLMPKSRIDQSPSAKVLAALKPGADIPAVVEAVRSSERKITLAPADVEESGDWKNYTEKPADSFGSLGATLRSALKENKDK